MDMFTLVTSLLLAVGVGVQAQQGLQGQQGVQGQQGQRQDERRACFPGEGELTFLRPDSAFPPTVEEFSYTLFRTLSKAQGEKSVLLSPYSVWSVLSLAYFGSGGNTQREIQNALNFVNKTHAYSNWKALRFFLENGAGTAELNVANRGYFSQRLQLNPCLSSEIFDLKLVDFTRAEVARQAINQDVSRATKGRIPELIAFLPPDTRFALINAIFFKGTWALQFDPSLTRPQEFLVPPGKSSGVVQMMHKVEGLIAGEAEGLDAKMVELPYLNSSISMFLLLPNDPLTPTSAFAARITSASFTAAVRSLPTAPVFISLFLPRFKLSTRYEDQLKSALASLGITSLFDPSRADLSGFARSPPLHVDTAIHQATVEVNEEGTVAAAATAFINTRFGPQKPREMVFNRPFLFFIVDKRTRIPLFAGRVTSAADLEEVSGEEKRKF